MSKKKDLSPKEVVVKFMNDWNAAMAGGPAKMEEFIAKFDDTCDPKMLYHHGDKDMSTKEFKDFSKEFVKAFPGNHYEIEDIIEVGNQCAVRYKWTGTMKGDFMGNPPTNKTCSLIILEWDIIKNSKFIESWARQDTMDWLSQLGLMG